jgi:hypothetical protein
MGRASAPRRCLGAGGLSIALRTYATPEHLCEITAAAVVAGFVAPMQYLLWCVARRKHAIEKACPTCWT